MYCLFLILAIIEEKSSTKENEHLKNSTHISVMCQGARGAQSVILTIGRPEHDHHPIHFQASALGKDKGLSVPSKIMESLQKIKVLSIENNVDFIELVEYAVKSNEKNDDIG